MLASVSIRPPNAVSAERAALASPSIRTPRATSAASDADLLPAIVVAVVVTKLASSPIAAANSFSVSNRPGAPSIREEICESVYAFAVDRAEATSEAMMCATTTTAPLEFSVEYFSFLSVELNQMRPGPTGLGSAARISTFRFSIDALAASVIPWKIGKLDTDMCNSLL